MRDLEEAGNVVAVAESLPRNLLIGHEDYDDKFDPHVWMNPNLWSRVVLNIRDALIEVSPENEDVFRSQRGYASRRAAANWRNTPHRFCLRCLPKAACCISAHDAFNYFGNAYGFEVLGIQGISTESEAGLQRISELVGPAGRSRDRRGLRRKLGLGPQRPRADRRRGSRRP